MKNYLSKLETFAVAKTEKYESMDDEEKANLVLKVGSAIGLIRSVKDSQFNALFEECSTVKD